LNLRLTKSYQNIVAGQRGEIELKQSLTELFQETLAYVLPEIGQLGLKHVHCMMYLKFLYQTKQTTTELLSITIGMKLQQQSHSNGC
jgi:hypothetical protein